MDSSSQQLNSKQTPHIKKILGSIPGPGPLDEEFLAVKQNFNGVTLDVADMKHLFLPV